jgi:hypothetical protein
MAGELSCRKGTLIVAFLGDAVITIANSPFGPRLETLNDMPGTFAIRSMLVREQRMTNPEFYLILNENELTDKLADAVYEAGFDDCSLTMRGKAAIWIRHRPGEFTHVVREALAQAKNGGLRVSHVEMESEVFA